MIEQAAQISVCLTLDVEAACPSHRHIHWFLGYPGNGPPRGSIDVFREGLMKGFDCFPWSQQAFPYPGRGLRHVHEVHLMLHGGLRFQAFPLRWWKGFLVKKVKIKVIYKKGDVEDVSNYRPICSLPSM